jgi:hypothetical protein
LEEINNGRLEGQFGFNIIKDSIPRGIPIIVFSNTPPILGALSLDRWDIMALYEFSGDITKEREIYIQKAIVSTNINQVTNSLIYYNDYIETIIQLDFENKFKSERLLLGMQILHIRMFKHLNRLSGQEPILTPGHIKKDGIEKVSLLIKAPSYVLLKAKEIILRNFSSRKY